MKKTAGKKKRKVKAENEYTYESPEDNNSWEDDNHGEATDIGMGGFSD